MMTEKDTMQVKPEKKEDRRVRRTKKLLTHGLIQLMKEKQVQDITVRELADLVDVNRGTFYRTTAIYSTCWTASSRSCSIR